MPSRLLSFVGPIHVISGVLLVLTAFTPDLQGQIAELAGLKGDNFSPFLFAVLGATIASWGVLFSVIVTQYLEYPSKRLWNALMVAVLVWAPLDTGLCIYYGIYNGAVVNGVVFVVLIVLLFNVRKLQARQ